MALINKAGLAAFLSFSDHFDIESLCACALGPMLLKGFEQ